jgi:alcohol dehydrogenase class IV
VRLFRNGVPFRGSDVYLMFAALRAPSEIMFGEGKRDAVAAVARRYGTRAFVCADPFIARGADFAVLMQRLSDLGVDTLVFTDVIPDLPIDTVADAVRQARAFVPDVLIGIGGGSSIDLAKVTSALLVHGGDVRALYGEFRVPGPVLPIIAVPTTAGTGSEATPVAVLTDPDRISKVGISSPHLIPRVAICDPELTYSCPPSVTASSGADALAHCIEALTAIRRPEQADVLLERVFVGRGELTDALAIVGIRHLAAGLELAYREPTNARARADVMFGSLVAGLAFATAGTAAAHAIQYPVGALTHTPHGLGVGTLLPYVMEFNRGECVPEMAVIARLLDGSADSPRTIGGAEEAELASTAPAAVARFLGAVGIPATLAELGFPAEKADWAASQAIQATRLAENNPRPLDLAGAKLIIRAAIDGDLSAASVGLAPIGEEA